MTGNRSPYVIRQSVNPKTVFPPLIECLTMRSVSKLKLAKNIFMMSFGLMGGAFGTFTSIRSVLTVLSSEGGEEECQVLIKKIYLYRD